MASAIDYVMWSIDFCDMAIKHYYYKRNVELLQIKSLAHEFLVFI